MGRTCKVNYPEATAMLAAGASYAEIAAKFGVKPEGLRVSFSRKGIVKSLAAHKSKLREVAKTAANTALQSISATVRGALAEEVAGQVSALRSRPVVSYAELANTPDGEGRATVVKKIVDTAAVVFGDWEQRVGGLVLAVELSHAGGQPTASAQVVDVDATQVAGVDAGEPVADAEPPDEPGR